MLTEKVMRDTWSGIAAAQIDALKEAVRDAVSLVSPKATVSSIQEPVRDTANLALSRALAPVRQSINEGMKANLRDLGESGSHTSADGDGGHKTENLPKTEASPGDNS
ncbi:hypothetical protein GCM10020255_026660 [Rhodococcus baikonurensis]